VCIFLGGHFLISALALTLVVHLYHFCIRIASIFAGQSTLIGSLLLVLMGGASVGISYALSH